MGALRLPVHVLYIHNIDLRELEHENLWDSDQGCVERYQMPNRGNIESPESTMMIFINIDK